MILYIHNRKEKDLKRRILYFLNIIALSINLTGCELENTTDKIENIVKQIDLSNDEQTIEPDNVFFEENSHPLDESRVTYYYYDRLIGVEKELYCILYNSLMAYNYQIHIPSHIDYDIVSRILKYVVHDHPNIFWFHEYTMVEVDGEHYLYPDYLMTEEDIEHLNTQCDRYMGDMFSYVSKNNSEYEIAKQVYEHILSTVEYRKDANDQNMLSAMLNQKAVCAGLSKLYQYVLQQYGIESCVVTGLTLEGTAHMWNLVKIDGEYYYTDLTYGKVNSSEHTLNYGYFNTTTKAITEIYEFEAGQILENCTSTKANYYSETGYIFHEIDEAKLYEILSKGLPAAIKCANKEIYEEMKDYLINQKNIYNFLPNTQINYQTFDDYYTIEFFYQDG